MYSLPLRRRGRATAHRPSAAVIGLDLGGRRMYCGSSGRDRPPRALNRRATKPAARSRRRRPADAGGREEGRQHAVDGPGLAPGLGDVPAEFGGDPGQRQATRDRCQRNQRASVPAGAGWRARRRRANSAMKKKPSPAMTRKLQNRDGTAGTVSQAAACDLRVGVASRRSACSASAAARSRDRRHAASNARARGIGRRPASRA
jgi:hypothetical protein